MHAMTMFINKPISLIYIDNLIFVGGWPTKARHYLSKIPRLILGDGNEGQTDALDPEAGQVQCGWVGLMQVSTD